MPDTIQGTDLTLKTEKVIESHSHGLNQVTFQNGTLITNLSSFFLTLEWAST